MDDSPPVGPDVEAAFSMLSDETRLDILRALYAADEPLSFSELRERVGTRDSGQFNYHLGKLTEHFVDQGEAGYELGPAGVRVLGAVFSGSYDGTAHIDPIPIEKACPLCEGALTAGYDESYLAVTCDDCGVEIFTYPAPPGILRDRDREALPLVFSQYVRTLLAQITKGICPNCLGVTESEIGSEETAGNVGVIYHCQYCGLDFTMTVGATLLTRPEVVQFAHDHDIDIQNAPLWEIPFVFNADERRVEDGPGVVEVSVTREDETLRLRLDDTLDVVELSIK